MESTLSWNPSAPPIWELPPDLKIGPEYDNMVMAPSLWHLPPEKFGKIHEKYTGRGVTVAVLDTGYRKHQLGPEPVASKSFISGQSVDDGHGHGTHCIGTVLGRYDGDQPIGLAPDAKLIVGKVLSNGGSGGSDGISDGIKWAVDQGADIISMSLGGGSSYAPTNRNIDYAWSKGCIVVVAAGNSGYSGRDTIGWPGKYTGSICTASYQKDGSISGFSSGGSRIDWACPGSDIISFSTNGSGYRSMSGTSMATPYGAGMFALIVQAMRSEGYAQWKAAEAVREWFKANMKDKGAPGFDARFGWGIPVAEELLDVLVDDLLVLV